VDATGKATLRSGGPGTLIESTGPVTLKAKSALLQTTRETVVKGSSVQVNTTTIP
jgi:hypothetical protein